MVMDKKKFTMSCFPLLLPLLFAITALSKSGFLLHVEAFGLCQVTTAHTHCLVPSSRVRVREQRMVWPRYISLRDNEQDKKILISPMLPPEEEGLLTGTTETTISVDNNPMSHHESIEWVDESKHVELVGLFAWVSVVSVFILINNFIGPWPAFMAQVPERFWFLGHMIGGMFFGGGVVLTTVIEWLVGQNKNPAVMQFWFDKVPLLDMALVLPGLTLSMISGTGLTIVRYGGLALAPLHIQYAFWALVAFACWWGLTDLTSQGSALNAVLDLSISDDEGDNRARNASSSNDTIDEVPAEVSGRLLSNLVSCFMVFVMYAIMVLKPGTLQY